MYSVEFSHLVWHTSWIYNPLCSLYKHVNQNDLLWKLWEGTLLCYPHMHVRPTQNPCCILFSITECWKAPADVIFAMQVKEYCDVTKPWKMRKSHEMGLVCELAELDQSHMGGSDTGRAQYSFTQIVLEPWRQWALQILLESWWWNCYCQPRCSYKEALQETPEASVTAKGNFPSIPQQFKQVSLSSCRRFLGVLLLLSFVPLRCSCSLTHRVNVVIQ